MDDAILIKNRQVKHCPPHFVKIPFYTPEPMERIQTLKGILEDQPRVEQRIRNWLHENCEHRFYIGTHAEPYTEGVMVERSIVGFEEPSDATYFSLVMENLTRLT
jgi:hypothetical protein